MERRADPRAAVSLMGAVELGGLESPALVLDLSPAGARLQVDSPPDLAHDYQLHFSVHGMAWSPHFRVIHWAGANGAYRWGCNFFDLPSDQRDGLRRSVRAASGAAELTIADWPSVLAAAEAAPNGDVLVGSTPAGRDIRLPARDCLEIGPQGVDLFVRTVASLETA
jgi:PilZ domain-containing protein